MRRFVITLILSFFFQWGFSQVPNRNYVSPFEEISTFNWKTANGLPYVKSFSGNYSIEVYKPLNNNQYAFLSKSEHALLVFNIVTGQKEKTIHLPFTPVDFAFSQDRFFVAGTQNLYVLGNNGKVIDKWFFGNKIKFVNSIKVIDNKVYLMTANQKTWFFDKTHSHLLSHDGIILNNDLNGKIIKWGSHRFSIVLTEKGSESFSKTIDVKRPLGTIRILGLSGTRLFVEVQTILKEVPLKVERNIRIYQITKSRLDRISSISLPDIYYTYIKHDINISDSNVDILISTPENTRIYKMNGLEKAKIKPQVYLPRPLYQKVYLYNNHLLPANERNLNLKNVKNTPITRQKIIQNAETYATHKWYCNPDNIRDYDCGGVHVKTPVWVTVGNNISVPYMWGGFSSLQQFDQGLKDGVSAGDYDTHGNGAGSSCAVGVDCSGFVSRAWGLGSKYSTRSIPNISTQYASYDDLRPGDVVNYAGHHVRLIHTVNGNGSFLIIEASGSGTDWRVGYNSYSTADFQGKYLPRRYDDVIEGSVDTTAPTTTISANLWETGDFNVHFTDKDNVAVKSRFYQVSYFDGSKWFADNKDGFFNDNFTNSLSTQWTRQVGTWTIVSNALNQSDETNSNTNIYATVQQKTGNSYLYQWRMKIGGAGTNRRAGLIFMSDDPVLSQRNNAYMVYFRVDQNTCQIYKSVNNSIHLETTDACTVNADEWFDAKVIFNSATGEIDVFKNNKLVSSWIDAAPLSSGNSISLRTGNANVSYDDIKVYRSRNTLATVTIGNKGNVPFQNPSPAQPACLLLSVVADSMHNISTVDSLFVNIDRTKPSDFTVNDGPGDDIDSTRDASQLSANWTPATDANSGIKAYFCCIGTSPGSSNVVSWFNNSSSTRFTKADLSLKPGDTCYVAVTAMNAAGLTSDTIVSDGVLILKPAGIHPNESNNGSFKVYPVPAKEMLWISYDRQAIASKPEVFDLSGKQIPVTVTKVSDNHWKISLKTVSRGFYFVRIKTRTGYLSRKFLVAR
jgi:hypothetical protein